MSDSFRRGMRRASEKRGYPAAMDAEQGKLLQKAIASMSREQLVKMRGLVQEIQDAQGDVWPNLSKAEAAEQAALTMAWARDKGLL